MSAGGTARAADGERMATAATLASYFEAWNKRNAETLKATFQETGLYRDRSLHLPAHPHDLGPSSRLFRTSPPTTVSRSSRSGARATSRPCMGR